jgi:CubicO group peptidase (beta-lactamase class C family)
MKRLPQLIFAWAALIMAVGSSQSRAESNPQLAAILEPIRVKYHLPALAGAVFTQDGVVEMAAVGVRKAGTDVPVTVDDLWHLGSDTKVMTAMLAGTFVAEKKLSWDDKIISYFPELAQKVPPAMKEITIAQVLRHQAGLSENLTLWQRAFLNGSPSQQRLQAVADILEAPAYPPGAFHYANNDYILIGAILEKMGGKPWEDLMRERIFVPLHMDSAGFGGTGTVGEIDQPWPHFASGIPAPYNGPDADNPAYMGPCGSVHLSMSDWAKFLADQLQGGNGMPALLPAPIYAAIQTPPANSEYAFGWGVTQRSWAGGKALNHAGSNTMNFCVCWLAPARKFGVVVCTNQGGDDAAGKATDEAAYGLILHHLAEAGFAVP